MFSPVTFPPVAVQTKNGQRFVQARTIRDGAPFAAKGTKLWNIAWGSKEWDARNNPLQALLLKETLQIEPEQYLQMHEHSPETIVFLFLSDQTAEGPLSEAELNPANLIGQIFGVGIGANSSAEIPRTWNAVTGFKTFATALHSPQSQRKECVSVYTDVDSNGTVNLFGERQITLGQFAAMVQFVLAVRSPSEVAMDAYSRPLLLNRLASMVFDLSHRPNNPITSQYRNGQLCDQFGQPLLILRDGIYRQSASGGGNEPLIRLADPCQSSIRLEGASLESAGYVIGSGSRWYPLESTEQGIMVDNQTQPLVDVRSYGGTAFEPMQRIHGRVDFGGLGGKIILVCHDGRVLPTNRRIGDLAALNHNLIFYYDIFSWLRDNPARFMAVLDKEQQALVSGIAKFYCNEMGRKSLPSAVSAAVEQLQKADVNPNRLIGRAFTVNKLRTIFVESVKAGVIGQIADWQVKDQQLRLDQPVG